MGVAGSAESVLEDVLPAMHTKILGSLPDGLQGPWKLKQGYTQVFACAQAIGSPTGATHAWRFLGILFNFFGPGRPLGAG